MVRILDFQSSDLGSNPGRITRKDLIMTMKTKALSIINDIPKNGFYLCNKCLIHHKFNDGCNGEHIYFFKSIKEMILEQNFNYYSFLNIKGTINNHYFLKFYKSNYRNFLNDCYKENNNPARIIYEYLKNIKENDK